jgi:hypothetical protein
MTNKRFQITHTPAELRLLKRLGTKTGLPHRNEVIHHAIARLAEREGIPIPTSEGRAAARKASAR